MFKDYCPDALDFVFWGEFCILKMLFWIEKHVTYGQGILFFVKGMLYHLEEDCFFQNKKRCNTSFGGCFHNLWRKFCWKNNAFVQWKCNILFFDKFPIVAFDIAFWNKNALCQIHATHDRKMVPFQTKINICCQLWSIAWDSESLRATISRICKYGSLPFS